MQIQTAPTHDTLMPPAEWSRAALVRTLARLCFYWRTAAWIMAATVLAGVVLAFAMPARYRSDARLLALGSDTYDVRSNPNAAGSEAFKPQEVVAVEMQLLASRDLHRAALIRSGMSSHDARALEQATDQFARHFRVSQISAANVIELSYVDRDPARAVQTLRNLLDVYLQSRIGVLASGRVAQLSLARDRARGDVERATGALRVFQAEHRIADIDAQIAGAISVDTTLREQRAQSAADQTSGATRLTQLRSSVGAIPATVELYRDDTEANRAIAEMQAQVLQLDAKRADLAGRYMQGSPLIDQIDKQLAGLRTAIARNSGQLSAARRIGRNSYYDAAIDRVRESRATLSGDAARRGQIERELAASGARLRTLNDLAGTIANLKLQADVAVDRYRLLSTQLEQASAKAGDATAGKSNVRVIQQPNLPEDRDNSRGLMIAGSIVAGLVLSAVGLFFRATGHCAVLDADEASESLHAPVIADLRVPSNGLDAGPRYAAVQRAGHTGSTTVALVMVEPNDPGQPVHTFIGGLERLNPGSVVTVTFEEGAYGLDDGQFTRLIARDVIRTRVRVGSAAWSIEGTGDKLLAMLRLRYRWIVLLVPPPVSGDGPGGIARRRIGLASAADAVLLIIGADRVRSHAAKTTTALLSAIGRPATGLVLTGPRLSAPAFARAL